MDMDRLLSIKWLSIAFIGFIFAYATWKYITQVVLHPLRQIPGPLAAKLTKHWETWHTVQCDRFLVIHQLHQTYGPVVRIGPNDVSVMSADAFHTIYVSKCNSYLKSDFYAAIQPGVGDEFSGIFNYTDPQRAAAERKDLQPLFSPASLKQYEARYLPLVDELVKKIKTKRTLDMFDNFKFLLLDTIGDLAFNQSFHQLESGEEHQYVVDFNNAFMLIGLQATFSWLIPFIPYLPIEALKNARDGLERCFTYARGRVTAYLESDEEKTGTLLTGYLDSKTGQLKAPYTEFSVAIAGHGFIIAGSEASSITMTYLLYLLAKNPTMEQRLRNELKTLPQNYANTDLSQLPFLDALLRETLRVYPPAPSPMPRVVPSGGLTVAGTFLPPGTIVSCQPYSMHRIPEIFPNPERFDPDRWLNVSKENRDRMLKAWVPFSAGQRGCVGRGLAWIHMMIGLVRILQEFESFEIDECMTEEDMELVERGALAKPRGTKLVVRFLEKGEVKAS